MVKRYGIVDLELHLKQIGETDESYDFPRLDIAACARSLGATGIRVTQVDEIRQTLEKVMKSNKPTVIDVIIDPDEVSPLKKRIESIQKNMKA